MIAAFQINPNFWYGIHLRTLGGPGLSWATGRRVGKDLSCGHGPVTFHTGPMAVRTWARGVRSRLASGGGVGSPLPHPVVRALCHLSQQRDSRLCSSSIFTLPGLTFSLAFLAGGAGLRKGCISNPGSHGDPQLP